MKALGARTLLWSSYLQKDSIRILFAEFVEFWCDYLWM